MKIDGGAWRDYDVEKARRTENGSITLFLHGGVLGVGGDNREGTQL